MPPKPRPLRKASTSSKETLSNGSKVEKDGLKPDMPPPPVPIPPAGILEPEMNALSGCLKNAVIKTGQVYSFFADTRKLGIQHYAPQPPRSLTSALGREVEKYDQLCDAIECHLLRAMTVLQRDISREERRIKDAQAALVAASKLTQSPTSLDISLPTSNPDLALSQASVDEPSTPLASTSFPPTRRPSAISLSSLHRPRFPLKLDLSSTTLRISPEEASLFSANLASPVTLAPKSARPTASNEMPPDLMAAFASAASGVDPSGGVIDIDTIDLTVPDNDPGSASRNGMSLDSGIGSSADKPIELDLESMDMDIDMSNMTDLFGDSIDASSNDASAAVDGFFSPASAVHDIAISSADDGNLKQEQQLDLEIFDALSAVAGSGGNDDLFTSLGDNNTHSLSLPEASSSSNIAPSPGALLATFTAATSNVNPEATSDLIHGTDSHFDLTSIDLSALSPGFFTGNHEGGMNLAEIRNLLDMEDGVPDTAGNNEISKGNT